VKNQPTKQEEAPDGWTRRYEQLRQGIMSRGGLSATDCRGLSLHLDWESGNLYGNWTAISPLLKHWIREQEKLTEWQYEIVCGLMDYEAQT